MLSAGGKRIRPTLGLLVGNMLGAPEEKLITLGASVELLHTATLVHDDLIDGALLRRGIPTLNARWSPAATVSHRRFSVRARGKTRRRDRLSAVDETVF
ncbi:MAG: polyprenyl synthetase family protein [Anaerolineales bacterium]